MKKLNRILFSLIAPVVDGNAKLNSECGMQNAELNAEYPLSRTATALPNGEPMRSAELDEKTLGAVYALARKHDLGHLLAGALRENAKGGMQNAELNAEYPLSHAATALPKGEPMWSAEFVAELEKAELTAVWRVKNNENEQGRVRKCLEEAQIPFVLLKGAVIRGFYPEAWMRTSSDIDLLVPREKLAEVVSLITSALDYRISTTEIHDASLISRSGVHLDVHTLFEGDGEDCRLLDAAWSSSSGLVGDTDSMERFLTPEHFYVYHVAHMAKHVLHGGCGIRPFIDLYLIRSHTNRDGATVEAMLTECGLARFEAMAVRLADAWMTGDGADLSPELSAFEEYVLTGGVYGSSEQYVAARQRGGKQGKARYILGRIFMPYEQLKKRHPVLEKHRYLTPFFEVYRWCGLLVPARFRRSRKELSSAMRVDEARVTSVEELLESLGL